MFEIQKVGVRIAKLRKTHNMTQTELADRLGVSFQAVSNWERGNSMPDISKLPELAQVFSVSIDDILGEKSDLVEAAINNEIDSYINENNILGKELENAIPILKSPQLKAIADKADKAQLTDIPELLQYMSSNDVYEMAMESIAAGKPVGAGFLENMSAADVSRLAVHEYNSGRPVNMYLEYISSQGAKEIAASEMNKGNPFALYLEYMSSSDVYELAAEAVSEGKFEISIFAEKMSAEDMGRLAIMEHKKGRPITDFLEYADSESLKVIVRDMM